MTGFVKIILSRFRKSNVNIPCIWIVIYTLQSTFTYIISFISLNSANSLSTHLNFEFSSFWEKKKIIILSAYQELLIVLTDLHSLSPHIKTTQQGRHISKGPSRV